MEGGLLDSRRDFGRFHTEDSLNRVRDGQRAEWSCTIAGSHDEFKKEL